MAQEEIKKHNLCLEEKKNEERLLKRKLKSLQSESKKLKGDSATSTTTAASNNSEAEKQKTAPEYESISEAETEVDDRGIDTVSSASQENEEEAPGHLTATTPTITFLSLLSPKSALLPAQPQLSMDFDVVSEPDAYAVETEMVSDTESHCSDENESQNIIKDSPLPPSLDQREPNDNMLGGKLSVVFGTQQQPGTPSVIPCTANYSPISEDGNFEKSRRERERESEHKLGKDCYSPIKPSLLVQSPSFAVTTETASALDAIDIESISDESEGGVPLFCSTKGVSVVPPLLSFPPSSPSPSPSPAPDASECREEAEEGGRGRSGTEVAMAQEQSDPDTIATKLTTADSEIVQGVTLLHTQEHQQRDSCDAHQEDGNCTHGEPAAVHTERVLALPAPTSCVSTAVELIQSDPIPVPVMDSGGPSDNLSSVLNSGGSSGGLNCLELPQQQPSFFMRDHDYIREPPWCPPQQLPATSVPSPAYLTTQALSAFQQPMHIRSSPMVERRQVASTDAVAVPLKEDASPSDVSDTAIQGGSSTTSVSTVSHCSSRGNPASKFQPASVLPAKSALPGIKKKKRRSRSESDVGRLLAELEGVHVDVLSVPQAKRAKVRCSGSKKSTGLAVSIPVSDEKSRPLAQFRKLWPSLATPIPCSPLSPPPSSASLPPPSPASPSLVVSLPRPSRNRESEREPPELSQSVAETNDTSVSRHSIPTPKDTVGAKNNHPLLPSSSSTNSSLTLRPVVSTTTNAPTLPSPSFPTATIPQLDTQSSSSSSLHVTSASVSGPSVSGVDGGKVVPTTPVSVSKVVPPGGGGAVCVPHKNQRELLPGASPNVASLRASIPPINPPTANGDNSTVVLPPSAGDDVNVLRGVVPLVSATTGRSVLWSGGQQLASSTNRTSLPILSHHRPLPPLPTCAQTARKSSGTLGHAHAQQQREQQQVQSDQCSLPSKDPQLQQQQNQSSSHLSSSRSSCPQQRQHQQSKDQLQSTKLQQSSASQTQQPSDSQSQKQQSSALQTQHSNASQRQQSSNARQSNTSQSKGGNCPASRSHSLPTVASMSSMVTAVPPGHGSKSHRPTTTLASQRQMAAGSSKVESGGMEESRIRNQLSQVGFELPPLDQLKRLLFPSSLQSSGAFSSDNNKNNNRPDLSRTLCHPAPPLKPLYKFSGGWSHYESCGETPNVTDGLPNSLLATVLGQPDDLFSSNCSSRYGSRGPVCTSRGGFRPYVSSLLRFRSYRFSPYYRSEAKLALTSLTHSNKLDPFQITCRYELTGTCSDPKCPFQHLRDVGLSKRELIRELVSNCPPSVSLEDLVSTASFASTGTGSATNTNAGRTLQARREASSFASSSSNSNSRTLQATRKEGSFPSSSSSLSDRLSQAPSTQAHSSIASSSMTSSSMTSSSLSDAVVDQIIKCFQGKLTDNQLYLYLVHRLCMLRGGGGGEVSGSLASSTAARVRGTKANSSATGTRVGSVDSSGGSRVFWDLRRGGGRGGGGGSSSDGGPSTSSSDGAGVIGDGDSGDGGMMMSGGQLKLKERLKFAIHVHR